MKYAITAALALAATPALAAEERFFTLANTDFTVLIAFLVFVAILIYFKVPGQIARMLDNRAATIRSELDEARAIREEAQTLLASYERKQKEVQEQAERIVANARDEATRAAEQAKADIQHSVERRLASAEEQIESARAAAIREIRDRAITVAVSAAREVVAEQLSPAQRDALIDRSITEVEAKLH